MKHSYDLSGLHWTLEGYTPYVWSFERQYRALGEGDACIDVQPIPAVVPGSVQNALRAAGILPDWNIGMNYRQCEWVEHRHWMYRTVLPDAWVQGDASFRLECLGLDYSGWIYINGKEVAGFKGTHIPHNFEITTYLKSENNVLEIIFDVPPRWLGQFGYTSQMVEWKPRFNYTWDWSPRLVQVGIWDTISLVAVEQGEIEKFSCHTRAQLLAHTEKNGSGILEVKGVVSVHEEHRLEISLKREADVIHQAVVSPQEFEHGIHWSGLPVELWWPNLEGGQPLYTLTCRLLNHQGQEQDRVTRRVGFTQVEWQPCEGAPEQADPWICVINGRPVFLQGVNFAPLCANFADLNREDYQKRLVQYRDLGLNLLRINACQFLEKQWFYDLCDELGLMVWQDFPLTSSGVENWPPEGETSIEEMAEIARSFVERRKHHISLLLWSGGNELQGDLEGRKTGIGKPCDLSHPMLNRLKEVVKELDPHRRYIPTSPSGPRAGADPAEFNQGLHWDVHGGAAMMGSLQEAQSYWAADDALFRSEVYCPGASPIETIRKYAGNFQTFPPTVENPYWTRLTTWWLDWSRLVALHGRAPENLEEYVSWSQAQQAIMLAGEMKACKDRFPKCGGVLLWSGHDTFPLAINSTLIDYDGNLKPAAFAAAKVWKGTE